MSELPDWKKLTRAEKGEAILPYLAAGESNDKIASRFLNCGRCQISGAVNRMKVAGLNPPSRRTASGAYPKGKTGRRKAGAVSEPKKALAPKRTARTAEVVSWRGPNNPVAIDFKARAEQRRKSPGIVIKRENAFDPIPGTTPIAFGSPGCKWPVDGVQGKGLLACGAAKDLDQSYCRAHRLLSYQPPTTRQRAGLQSAERIS